MSSATGEDPGGGGAAAAGRSVPGSAAAIRDSVPPQLRPTLEVVRAAAQPLLLWWGAEPLEIANAAGQALLAGAGQPAAGGQAAGVRWGSAWDRIAPRLAEARARGVPLTIDEALLQTSGGSWGLHLAPLLEAAAGEGAVLVTPLPLPARGGRQSASLDRSSLRGLLVEVFENLPTAVGVVHGPRHEVELINPAGLRLIGDREVLRRPLGDVIPELAGQGYIELLDRMRETGEPFVGAEMPVWLRRAGAAGPGLAYFNCVLQPLWRAGGRPRGILVFAAEVTELVEARRRSDELAASVAVDSRRKDELLAMLGHELRNPLAPVRTATHLLSTKLETLGPERVRWAVDVIERQVEHLVHLVDGLVDMARLTRDRIQLNLTRVSLQDLVADAVECAAPEVEVRGHEVSLELPGAPILVHADASRLRQVLVNLLANAAQYTPDGGRIRIRAEAEAHEAVLVVSDDGSGIAPELLPHVFDVFTQAPAPLHRHQGGLGLGLALVRRLVEMHGGRVLARSAGPAQGSSFEIRLPIAAEGGGEGQPQGASDVGEGRTLQPGEQDGEAAGATAIGALSLPIRPRRRVLVLERDRSAAEAVAELLERRGVEAMLVFDAAAALILAKVFKPHVALVDLARLDDGGLAEFSAALVLACPGTRPRVVVLVSGRAPDAPPLGGDLVLVRPLESDALLAALEG